jgi:hypothetical protein
VKKIYTVIFLLEITFFLASGQAYAASKIQEIDIAATPEKVLFDVSNFKPGDWAERTLFIQNQGKQDFDYVTSVQLRNGSKKYFNELRLTITSGHKTVFDGKLKDIANLKPRYLERFSSEKLRFKIFAPEELRNEYQGSGCEAVLIFYAEKAGGPTFGKGAALPKTATETYNLIALGGLFVCCGIILQTINRKINKGIKRT